MQRRTVLKGLAALAATPMIGAAGPVMTRVRPGDPGWPSSAAWDGLKAAVNGNLIAPTDLFAGCAASDANCADAMQEIGNPFFIGDQAGGTQVSGWLNAWSPKASAYAVAA